MPSRRALCGLVSRCGKSLKRPASRSAGGQDVATIYRGRVLLKGTGPMEMYRVEATQPSGHAGGHEGGHVGGHEGGHEGGHAAREDRVLSSSPDDDLFARVPSDSGNKS